jgi:hypothetical protein
MKGREARFPGWQATILGGSFQQSEKSYEATDTFWRATEDIGAAEVLDGERRKQKTSYLDNSWYKILTASNTSVRGDHPQTLFLDEIDEMPVDVFQGALFQPQSKRGHKSSYAMASTRHKAAGLMSIWVDSVAEKGFKLYTSCILEAMEACYDYRCDTCPLDKWCKRRMKPVMVRAYKEQLIAGVIHKGEPPLMGFNTVEDVVTKINLGAVTSQQTPGLFIKPLDVDAELFCLRPSRTGLVYDEFDDIHSYPNDVAGITEIPRGWKRYRSFDFGLQHPWVCIYLAVDPMDRVYVYDEVYVTGQTTEQMVPEITGRERDVEYTFNVADPAGSSDRRTLFLKGIPTWGYSESIMGGIQLVKNALRLRPDGKPGLYINKEKCPYTHWEISQAYRYSDKKISDQPLDENNHAMDCLKNWFVAYNMGEPKGGKGQYW